MLDNDALNLVSDVIEAIHGILQMLVDLATTDELERIPSFGLLVEQLETAVVGVGRKESVAVLAERERPAHQRVGATRP